MDFSAIRLNDGTIAIRADGKIEDGDAEKLRAVASQASVGQYGERILILNSEGGDVFAAMETGDVINAFDFMTVVAWGDVCFSACSSVLYVAGNARLVLGDGKLVIHECDPPGSPVDRARAVASCNADIARYAGQEGYPPDLMFTAMQSSFDQAFALSPTPNIHCQALLQPIWIDHIGRTDQPCFQLIRDGVVSWARDWEQIPNPPRVEEMQPDTPVNTYVLNWSPPGAWSHGFHEDGATIGFRRWGRFPAGPELEIACHRDHPGARILFLNRLAANADRDVAQIRFTAGQTVSIANSIARFQSTGNDVGQSYTLTTEVFLFTDRLTTGLKSDHPRVTFELLDAPGNLIDRIETDTASAARRIEYVEDNCAGRFPRS